MNSSAFLLDPDQNPTTYMYMYTQGPKKDVNYFLKVLIKM